MSDEALRARIEAEAYDISCLTSAAECREHIVAFVLSEREAAEVAERARCVAFFGPGPHGKVKESGGDDGG